MSERNFFQEWEVAESGMSGWVCPECDYSFTEFEASEVCRSLSECPNIECGELITPSSMETILRKDNIRFFEDEAILGSTWFHATTRENWIADLLADESLPLVHVGSRSAAFNRGRDLRDSGEFDDLQWFLYEVTLSASEVFPTVLTDMGDYAPFKVENLTAASRYNKTNAVVRYVNAYEEPGSISLVVDARNLIVVKRTEVNPLSLDVMFNELLAGHH